jgi:hypothetical protein
MCTIKEFDALCSFANHLLTFCANLDQFVSAAMRSCLPRKDFSGSSGLLALYHDRHKVLKATRVTRPEHPKVTTRGSPAHDKLLWLYAPSCLRTLMGNVGHMNFNVL